VFSQRVKSLLEIGERRDLQDKVDKLLDGALMKMFSTNACVSIVVGVLAYFYITDGEAAIACLATVAFFFIYIPSMMFDQSWEMLCTLHSYEIEMLHDNLKEAFEHLATNNEESPGIFDVDWSRKMTVQFIDSTRTMQKTNLQIGSDVGVNGMIIMIQLCIVGLNMVMSKVTILELASALVISCFFVVMLTAPLICNTPLNLLRFFSWECYGEMIGHTLIQENQADMEEMLVLHGVKHLLILIQNSKEGLKIGNIEFSLALVQKALSIMFSGLLIILRTSDLSELGIGGNEADGIAETEINE
jgi:hypothetical protein